MKDFIDHILVFILDQYPIIIIGIIIITHIIIGINHMVIIGGVIITIGGITIIITHIFGETIHQTIGLTIEIINTTTNTMGQGHIGHKI